MFRNPWTITIDISVSWTVFISPRVFVFDDTLVNFTSIDRFIGIIVTVNNEVVQFFFSPRISEIDLTITVGI